MEFVAGAVAVVIFGVVGLVATNLFIEWLDARIRQESSSRQVSKNHDTISVIQDRVHKNAHELADLRTDLSEVEETLMESDGQLDSMIEVNELSIASIKLLQEDVARLRTGLNTALTAKDVHGYERDSIVKELKELRAHIGEVGVPLYYGVILNDGMAVHTTPEKGSSILHILNKDTRVMIYEIKNTNGVNWARVEEEGWIHGGWEYRHPPQVQGGK
jgi:hypothetical protein